MNIELPLFFPMPVYKVARMSNRWWSIIVRPYGCLVFSNVIVLKPFESQLGPYNS